jgi:serine/threonine protein kinase
VRKEVDHKSINLDEKIALRLLARSEELRKVHLIKLVFSYGYGDKFNYVFKRYRGSLQDIFDHKLKLQNSVNPQSYRGSKLQHRLWQGAVDIVEALASFHAQSSFHDSVQGEQAAAHFDVKSANILVDEDDSLTLADFGEAQIVNKGKRFTTQGGDYNYQPPRRDPKSGWSQAYDVWSMACVLTEIIEYIINVKDKNRSEGVTKFRTARELENPANAAFWIGGTGRYELRLSVKKVLEGFRSPDDEYLNLVADLLDRMFEVEESKRPSMAECFNILSQKVTSDTFPQSYEGEISIMRPGTMHPLRNM